MAELEYLLAFAFVLAFFGALIYLGIPEDLQLLDTFDLGILIVEITGIAGTCVIATGIPCAVAFVVASIYNIFNAVIVNQNFVQLFIMLPLSIGISYILSKLARGN